MTSTEIFNQYFKKQLLIWGSIGVIATIIRLLGWHQISIVFVLTMLCYLGLAVLIIGYIDYRFYEKLAPGIIAQLLDKEPLLDFQKNGFIKDGVDMLEGTVNNYLVLLSPLTRIETANMLVIHIAIQPREGLEDYFPKYNDNFRLSFTDEVLFVKAILEDYERLFDFNKLFQLIDMTTLSFKENQIDPLKMTNE